jgi:hypothetical protein
MERKLAAILCADVYGYSRLMGEDEEATLRTLTSHRKIIDSQIENHHGRFVNSAGDSVLAEFASVVEAVNCAVEIQTGLKAENGDVMVEGAQIYGDGVNVAARKDATDRSQVSACRRVILRWARDHRCDSGAGATPVAQATANLRVDSTEGEAYVATAEYSLDCGVAIREPQRGPQAGILQRWYHRPDNQRSLAPSGSLCHCAQFPAFTTRARQLRSTRSAWTRE